MRMLLCLFVALISVVTAFAIDRETWIDSRVTGSPEPPKPYRVERAYPRLEFKSPVELMPLADTGKMLLLEVGGRVLTFDDDPDCEQADVAGELANHIDNVRRALGIAPHPRFNENRQIFIAYAGDPAGLENGSRLSRFVMTKDDPPKIDIGSEEILLQWHSGGHNGCAIRFDSAGYLYFSTGDGAKPYPPDEYNVGQDLSDLRSCICRIDVDNRFDDLPYSIPTDNPFIKTPNARPEVFAYGLRNPWRFSIDRKSGQILCGDVGWELWELIFHVEKGGNCGWPIYEGPQPIRSDINIGPTPITKPLVAYPHTVGLSVTGGFIYHGDGFPELQGSYLYGDYVTGKVWSMRFEGQQLVSNEVIAETGLAIITFAESRDGEVLLMSHGGTIHRLVKNEKADESSDFPRLLSETGLFSSVADLTPAKGVYQYQILAKSFEDGATSELHIGIPGDQQIRLSQRRRAWKYPENTVFVKTVSQEVASKQGTVKRRIETQMLHFNGSEWQPYSYKWNEDQTDAHLVDASGDTVHFTRSDGSNATWKIQNRSECRACHSMQQGGAVSFDLPNLDRPSLFDSSLNQIEAFIELGILDRKPPANWNIRSMIDPHDQKATIELRARSYLAANCAHCHSRGGGGTVALDLPFSIPTEKTNSVDFMTTQGNFGIDQDARVIVPGDPYRSILYYRMATSGKGHMPKVWGRDNDGFGLSLVHDWILSMKEDAEIADNPQGEETSLTSTSDALRLLNLIEQEKISGLQLAKIVEAGIQHEDVAIKGLFERYVPTDQRTKRLGSQIDPAVILAMTGDAERGRERFVSSTVLSCRNCHKLGDIGDSLGPSFDEIGKKYLAEHLLESIIEPSKKIAPEYVTYSLLTFDGRVLTGLRISQDANTVVLRSDSGSPGKPKEYRIATNEIDEMSVQQKSLMPEGLATEMTAQELADLLAFLTSLK